MISNAAIQLIFTNSLGKLVQYGALIVVLVDLIKEGEKPTKEKLTYSSPMNCFYEQRELAFVPLIHKSFLCWNCWCLFTTSYLIKWCGIDALGSKHVLTIQEHLPT
jgi:hypothetical protein